VLDLRDSAPPSTAPCPVGADAARESGPVRLFRGSHIGGPLCLRVSPREPLTRAVCPFGAWPDRCRSTRSLPQMLIVLVGLWGDCRVEGIGCQVWFVIMFVEKRRLVSTLSYHVPHRAAMRLRFVGATRWTASGGPTYTCTTARCVRVGPGQTCRRVSTPGGHTGPPLLATASGRGRPACRPWIDTQVPRPRETYPAAKT